jgi:hypothetical protein
MTSPACSVRRFVAFAFLLYLCDFAFWEQSASAAIFAPTEEELDAAVERSPQTVPDVRSLPHITKEGKTYVRMGDTFLQTKDRSCPTNSLESAIVRSLQPGAYTAIVREYHNYTGVALVEVYQLP